MKAMQLEQILLLDTETHPLVPRELARPEPGPGEVLIRVSACGVCHTELDEIEGRTPPPALPVIPGHEVVGRLVGPGRNLTEGQRVGVAWIFSACGRCAYCRSGLENLCAEFKATGRDANGGYAEYMTVLEDFVHPIPEAFSDVQAAPLLCAGAVGYRSLELANLEDGRALGLTGFGASAHLVLQMARHRFSDLEIFVFARSPAEREFALQLGASWAGDTDATAPRALDAVIDTTPVYRPVVESLRNLAPGGRLVINAIRKENVDRAELSRIDYPTHLWMEKEIKSVANVTRKDVREFLKLAAEIPIMPEVQVYPLQEANRALMELKQRMIRGAKVLQID
jgi:alcohol dehydrogenase, propanol-preferring